MIRWKKSSKSGNQGECVELAHNLGAVRDSKQPGGPVLNVPIAGFLATIKGGQLDR